MTEANTREALKWAIGETVLRIPPSIPPSVWNWDHDDLSLFAVCDDGEFRFHVMAERRAGVKTRIAVLSVTDDNGKVTWEAPIPAAITPEGETK